ncbi:tetratricopeptide repeat protein, partial [Ancylostoma caninum]
LKQLLPCNLSTDKSQRCFPRQAASRLIELASFRGDFYRCLLTHRSLVDRFPEEVDHQIDVALTFIKMKRLEDAKKVLHNIIENDPNNAVALAYYGYILKVAEDNTEQGVAYMKKGLRLGGDEIIDAKFYYHLGQGLMMLGRPNEAYSVFEHAAALGLFLSAQQRSMYNVEGLTGRAWWSSEQTGYGSRASVGFNKSRSSTSLSNGSKLLERRESDNYRRWAMDRIPIAGKWSFQFGKL